MLELAELCHERAGLDHFSYISTAYVAGTHKGEFGEDQLDVGQRFRNPYEQSKFEAERLVRAAEGRLPIQIFRPSIVVGERTTGWTPAFNVLYSPLKAFVRGSLPAVPARRSAPVDVVPVDYVADAVFELAGDPVNGTSTYHLVAGPRATSVGRLIELSARAVGQREPVVIPPGLFRRLMYPVLVRTSDKLRQGLERTSVFFPYFAMEVSYGNPHARAPARAGGHRGPADRVLLRAARRLRRQGTLGSHPGLAGRSPADGAAGTLASVTLCGHLVRLLAVPAHHGGDGRLRRHVRGVDHVPRRDEAEPAPPAVRAPAPARDQPVLRVARAAGGAGDRHLPGVGERGVGDRRLDGSAQRLRS